MESRLFATPFAAIWLVPNAAMMLTTSTRPSWKIPFSIPLGMPIKRIRFTIVASTLNFPLVRKTRLSGLCKNVKSTTPATPRETNDGMATPATPSFSTYTPIAFPTTLMTFISSDIFNVICAFPIERYSAAHESYTARSGNENTEIMR